MSKQHESPAQGSTLQSVLDEMIGVATGDDDSALAEWTSQNRATIDLWQCRIKDAIGSRSPAGTLSPSDAETVIAGIKRFGLASDGSDLRDLSFAVCRLRAQVERLTSSLRESLTDNAWNAYHCGVTKEGGKWMDGGMSDAEWLQRELGLGDGWHDCADIQKRIPEVVEKQIASLAIPSTVRTPEPRGFCPCCNNFTTRYPDGRQTCVRCEWEENAPSHPSTEGQPK